MLVELNNRFVENVTFSNVKIKPQRLKNTHIVQNFIFKLQIWLSVSHTNMPKETDDPRIINDAIEDRDFLN